MDLTAAEAGAATDEAPRPRPGHAFYRAIIEAVSDGLLVVDGKGAIALANPQAEALLGYSRGELVGRQLEQLLPERYRDAHRAERARFADPHQKRPLGSTPPFMALRKDGTEVPIEIGLSSLSTPEGVLTVAVMRDISSRLAVERELREANERTRLIIDEAPIGKAIVGLDGRLLRVNRAFCELVGYSEAELTARGFQDITHPDDVATDLEYLDRLLRGELPRYQREKRYIRKDGSVVRVAIWVSLARDAAKAPRYFIAQVEDVTERWRASEALRRSEFRYQTLIDEAPVGVFVADLDGRYTEVNAAGCRMLGCQPEDLIGKTIVDLIPPEDVPRLEASKQLMLTPGKPHVAEWKLKHRDGHWVAVEVSAAILPDERWQAFVVDISARKQAEEALRESEERLRRAQRVAHLGSWEWDLRTGEVLRSPELYLLYGLEPTEEHPRALSLLRQIPEEQREQVFEVIDGAVKASKPYSIEHRVIRPDGEERVFLLQSQPELEGGVAVKYTGTALDITELRQAEREREEALRELRAVLEECPVGLNIIRDNGASFEPNAMARQMHGPKIAPDGGLGQLVGKMKSPEGVALRYEELPSVIALEQQRAERRELRLEPGDGRKIPVEVSAAPIFSPDGGVSSVVVVLRDLTQLKELERLRSEWNSIIAHDLRQPLNNISIFAQLLARQPLDWTPQARQALSQIKEMTQRLSRMTFDLLDLSRLDASRLTLTSREVDLGKLAGDCVARASLEAPDRKLELRARGDLPVVMGDPDRLAQVLENLLSNAIKYGAPGTPIEIELASSGQLITVSVTNQGKGIASAEIGLVFERFGRARAGKGGKGGGVKGIGLGLSIVKGLVEAHGGHIGVESVPDGKTTFWFTLPIYTSA